MRDALKKYVNSHKQGKGFYLFPFSKTYTNNNQCYIQKPENILKQAQFEEILGRFYLPENTAKILQFRFQDAISQIQSVPTKKREFRV